MSKGANNEVTYIRTLKSETVDYAAAVVDMVASTSEPVSLAAAPCQKTGWAHKHGFTYCTWKKRFLRLERASLAYYKQESSSAPKGVIPLTPYSNVKKCKKGDSRAANAVGYIKLVNGIPTVEKVRRDNGLAVSVPESARTFYIHFASARERDEWYVAVGTNIEVLRRAPGVLEDMIGKVEALADSGTVPREKAGIIKMALRGRFLPRIDPASPDPFIRCMLAVAAGDVDDLRRRLQPEHLTQATATGTTLLLKAATIGGVEAVRLLLERGAAVDQAKHDGDTPLIVAARLNHVGVVRLLLEKGADKTRQNQFKETAYTEGRHPNGYIKALLDGENLAAGGGTGGAAASAPELSLDELQRIISIQTEALARAQSALEQAQQGSEDFATLVTPATADLPPNAGEALMAVAATVEERRQTMDTARFQCMKREVIKGKVGEPEEGGSESGEDSS